MPTRFVARQQLVFRLPPRMNMPEVCITLYSFGHRRFEKKTHFCCRPVHQMTDKEIVKNLLAEGQRSNLTLTYLYKSTFPTVQKMVSKYGGVDDDAKDIFQETILAFYKMVKNGKFRKESSINTILYAIARNLWYRKVKKLRPTEDLDTHMQSMEDLSFEANENILFIRNLIHQLGDDCRKIVTKYYYEKWSIEAIQEEFKLGSIQAAKNKKYRCMQTLIKLFEQYKVKSDILSND